MFNKMISQYTKSISWSKTAAMHGRRAKSAFDKTSMGKSMKHGRQTYVDQANLQKGMIGNMPALGKGMKAGGSKFMNASPMASSALGGMAMGGVYGAVSDDTSILGGMALGGMAGAGGYAGFNKMGGMSGIANSKFGRNTQAAGLKAKRKWDRRAK